MSANKITNGYSPILSSNILIVDDSELSLSITSKALEDSGFKNIKQSLNGKKALESINGGYRPDIIISDINMPEMDGFELTENIRKIEDLEDTPILMQTAADNPENISKAFDKGANDFVLKPVNPSELTTRVMTQLENSSYKIRIKEELKKAIDLQNSTLPSQEEIKSIEKDFDIKIGSHFQPSSEVGGDFWGFKPISRKELAVYTVDLTGHGIAAAMNTFRTQSLMEDSGGFITNTPIFLKKLGNKLNAIMPTGQFATMFYGIINSEENKLHFSSAAAPRAIILRKNGETEILEAKGLPLGIAKDIDYERHSVDFNKEDSLLLYSDALIETYNENEELLDENKVAKIISKNHQSTPNEIVKNLVDRFKSYVGERPIDDDLTINLYKRLK